MRYGVGLVCAFALACGGDPDIGCPADEPFAIVECRGDLSCSYGFETCCGETYASTICDCLNGAFGCYATDACYGVVDFGCGGSGGSGGTGGEGGTSVGVFEVEP